MIKYPSLLAALLTAGFTTASAQVLIVSDNFSGATFDAVDGVVNSAMTYGPLSNTTSTNLNLNVGSSGGNPGEYLAYGHSTGTTSFFTANLPSSVALASVGDWVQI